MPGDGVEFSDQHLQDVPSSAKGWLLDGKFCGISDKVLSKSNFCLIEDWSFSFFFFKALYLWLLFMLLQILSLLPSLGGKFWW